MTIMGESDPNDCAVFMDSLENYVAVVIDGN